MQKKKTDICLASFIKQCGMDGEQAIDAVLYAAKELDKLGLAYIHLAKAD